MIRDRKCKVVAVRHRAGGEEGRRFSLANQVISLTNCGRTVAADLC